MRVLHVLSCLELGGTEASVMNHYREIRSKEKIDFDFAVFTTAHKIYIEEICEQGGRVFFVGAPKMTKLLPFLLNMIRIMNANGPYDVVHCHANEANCWPILAAAIVGVPARISHFHSVSIKGETTRKRISLAMKILLTTILATHCVACSREAGESFLGRRFFLKKGILLNNGINLCDFVRRTPHTCFEKKQELEIGNAEPIVGNITRFDSNKNPLFVIKVFLNLRQTFPNAVLLMGGFDGGMLKASKKFVEENGLEEHVKFIGVRTDVNELLQIIDIYLFPSVSEGLGIALLEAQAAGCMCVASTGVPKAADMGLGSVEFLRLNVTAEKWAERIAHRWDGFAAPDPEQIRYAFAKKGFSVSVTAERLVRLYYGEKR